MKYKKFKEGGRVSLEGYRKDSPDRFNDFNVIPSNHITMRDVPYPVFGVDTLGVGQVMYPGYDYRFPGQAVFELPLRYWGGGYSYQEGGEVSRLVSVVPEGYKYTGERQGKKYYAKDMSYSLPMASSSGRGGGGDEYEAFLVKHLNSGVTPEELAAKKYILSSQLDKYRSYYIPRRDVVHTEQSGVAPVEVDNPVQGFSGDYLFGPNQHAIGQYRYKTRGSTGKTDPGMLNTAEQDAEFMFVDKLGRPDPSLGYYRIPGNVFSNRMTAGTNMLRDTTGISQYKVPFVLPPPNIESSPSPAPASGTMRRRLGGRVSYQEGGGYNPFIDTDTAAIFLAGQDPGLLDFFERRRVMAKDNQPSFGVGVQGLGKQAPASGGTSQGQGQGNGKTYTKYGANPVLAGRVVGGLSFLNNALESGDRNRYMDWLRLRGLGDNIGSVAPGSRGDYTMNEGYFRPTDYVPVQFGSLPKVQSGGIFDEPIRNVAPLAAPTEVAAYAGMRGNASNSNGGSDSGGSVESSAVGMEVPVFDSSDGSLPAVRISDVARKAYDYYMNDKGLSPRTAAGIVGNLFWESGLKPSAKEQGHTQEGRGIAQWDVNGRWKGFQNWARKQERNPGDLYTQLDYVLMEPGESERALKMLEGAKTPEEAAYVFGKVYERPLDKRTVKASKNPARWDMRAAYARKLYDEVMLDTNVKGDVGMSDVADVPPDEGNDVGAPAYRFGGERKGLLGKVQEGGVVDYYKQQQLKDRGKYLITDKGTNRTYYGYRGPDGKLVENSFEVLTGKTGDTNYYSPYSLGETERKSAAFQDNIRITPVGSFPLRYNSNIYGNAGLNIDNSGGLAMHVTYDPAVRNAYYNNNNPRDNYASYGCINCRKPDIDNVLKGFGNNDVINIVDSRRTLGENRKLAHDNAYLYEHPEAAKLLFERPGARVVDRRWNEVKGVYEGADSDYDPYRDMIIEKRALRPVEVVAKGKRKSGDSGGSYVERRPAVDKDYVSIVDYLNERGVDSSKANRQQLAKELGMEGYNYTAEDNLKLLNLLQHASSMAGGNGGVSPTDGRVMEEGGGVEEGLRRSVVPVRRDEANIEAERGETVTGDFDEDGVLEHLTVGGKRHTEGGTPLRVPSGSFVFSDTKRMGINGPLLGEFGKQGSGKKKYTPAALAKQYDLNKYKAILEDRDSDRLEQETALLMLANNGGKLGKLALLQEGMKGFPNGIPSISMPLIQRGLDNTSSTLEVGSPVKAADGYYDPPVDPYKGDKYKPRRYQEERLKLEKGFNKFDAPWLKDFGYENTTVGLDRALQDLGYTGDTGNAKDVQTFLINSNLGKGNVGLFSDLLKRYGVTNQGIQQGVQEEYIDKDLKSGAVTDAERAELMKIYADGLFGVRSGEMLRSLLRKPLEPTKVADVARFNYAQPKVSAPAPVAQRNLPVARTDRSINWKKAPEEDMPWWLQDDINLASAIGRRYNLKKYMPTYVSPGVYLPRPTFYDPTRQLAANAEQAAAQNMLSGMYAGAQRLRAVGSNVQGQASTNAANILGQVANQNVGVANQFAGASGEVLNNKLLQDAAARRNYVNELATVNQQYDNSVVQADDMVRSNLVNAVTNAQKAYWLNKMNDQFNINPESGRMYFKKGKGVFGDRSGGTGSAATPAELYNYHYAEFVKANPNLAKLDDKANEYAMKRIQSVDKSSAGNQQALLAYMGLMGGGRGPGYEPEY